MLRQEQNDLLTQTGPGTPGQVFRRYWLPALLAEDCPRTTARRYGCRFFRAAAAFRDSQGASG